MAFLPALLKPEDTQTKLSKARDQLSATEARLQRLQDERTTVLDRDDYLERAGGLRGAIEELQAQIVDHRGRVSILEQRLAREEQEYRERRYQEAVEQRAASKAQRVRDARELEKALKAVAEAARKFCNGGMPWPDGVHWPPVMPIYSKRMVGKLVESMFHIEKDRFTGRPPEPDQFLDRLLDCDRKADGFAAAVADAYDAQLAALRAERVPEPEPPEPEESDEPSAETEAA